jgi:hypothetical protein
MVHSHIQLSIDTNTNPALSSSNSTKPSPAAVSSLSTAAKAEIGVVIPLSFLALIAGIFHFFRPHNRRNRQVYHELPTSLSVDFSNWAQMSAL